MGQNSSRQSVASSIRGRVKHPRLRKRGNSDLSAAFNMLDVDLHYEQLNINLATEEELMTLPGITRAIAKNVIEYKQTIGAFRKVEDLALVSGVGATKLEVLRPEICVVRRLKPNASQTSSLNGSTESIPSSVTSYNRSIKLSTTKVVNINKANVFQLMTIRGVSQELAANIVHYREKKGLFKLVDEMVRVKGITQRNLGELRQFLTVDENANPVELVPRTPQKTPLNIRHTRLQQQRQVSRNSCASKSTSFDMSELFDLLSARSKRPVSDDSFSFRHNGRAALRLATWNLQQFHLDKADNPGVREVICRTILENGFSLIACQELGDREVLDKVCAELTNPCLRNVQEWSGHRGTWECVTSSAVGQSHELLEYCGFLYDTSKGIDFIESGLLSPLCNQENGNFPNRPFWAAFRVDKVDFTVVCIPVLSTQANKRENALTDSSKMEDMLKHLDRMQLSKNIVILGDPNLSPIEPEFNSFRENSYTHIVPVGTFTNSNTRTVTGGKHYDNIWISKPVNEFFTGHWGVVKQGLSHLAIPQGWTWGGTVSDHCPVWAEFFVQPVNSDLVSIPIANGGPKDPQQTSTAAAF